MKHVLAGIGGVARAGKDTFATLLRQEAFNNDYSTITFAFADALKSDLDEALKAKYGISAWTQDPAEKKVIRPELVAHGKGMRDKTGGRYWINQLDELVKTNALSPNDLPHSPCFATITDVRYATHPDDEAGWVKSLGGKLVYVERILPDGTTVGPANDEEAANDALVREAADIMVSIPTFGEDYLLRMRPYVIQAYTELTQ